MLNALRIEGAPFSGAPAVYAEAPASADMYGECSGEVQVYALSDATDMDALGAGLLEDLAVPSQRGRVEILHGNAQLWPGMHLEVRGAGAVARARIESVTHLMRGCHVVTRAEVGPPLRSVSDPPAYMVRSQSSPESYYALRLDHARAGLDAEYHLL
jgi:hypothetical protein